MATSIPNHLPDNNATDTLVTLKDFIDDHQKVLAVIGVFTALAVFWSGSAYKGIASYAAFWCLIVTLPLYYEVYRRFDFNRSSWSLIIFINLLTPIIFYSGWYVLVAFRPQWHFQMSNLILWALFIPLWMLLNRFRIAEQVDLWVVKRLVLRPRKKQRRVLFRQLRSLWKEREQRLAAGNLSEDEKKQERTEWKERLRQVPSKTIEDLKGVDVAFIKIMAFLVLLLVCTIVAKVVAPLPNNWLDSVNASYQSDLPANSSNPTPSPTP